jgi:tetratricopeptide (TPR) repeat protein
MSMSMRAILRAAGLAAALQVAGLAPVHQARAQQIQAPPPSQGIQLSPLAQRLIEADYLTEEERREKRVFHGVWAPGDLTEAPARARAALAAGVWDDPSLSDESVPLEVRAEARLERGDLREAVELIDAEAGDAISLRALRIKAEALEGLGEFRKADRAVAPAAARLSDVREASAAELVEIVRALRVRSRVRGLPAQDYQSMMGLLARARELDPLHWPAALEEARLLHAKDNFQEAGEAAQDALELNPRSIQALALLAEMSVQGFNFDRTELLADVMDAAAASVASTGEAAEGDGAGSALARLWLAHAMLRQNDPDLAEELLAPLLDRFPRHRMGVSTGVAIEAVRYNLETTEAALDAFDELSPDSPLALYVAGRAMSENRQYDYAAELLERAVARQPNWPPPIVALGLLHVQAANDDLARKWLSRAVDLDPFQRRARNSLQMLEGLAEFETLESEHFIVRYEPGVDRVMAEEMLPVLERIHERVAGEFEHEPDRKTVIELMPDHEWFAVRITGMPAIHTIAAATGPLIAMEAPKVGPNHSGIYDWPRVVQHEYAHTITLSRTKNRIPHWFTEAAAVNVEDAPRDWDTWRLLEAALTNDQLFDMREINIAFVRPKKPTDRGQAYAQGAWMYQYLKETFGEQAPLELMDLYAQGLREDEAMREALGISRRAFYDGFVDWAWEDARAHGLAPSPSLAELRLEATLADEEAREKLEEALGESADRVARSMLGAAELEARGLPLAELDADAAQALLKEHPGHPLLLSLIWEDFFERTGGEVTAEVAKWLERYAAARPVDPEPHRLLASHYLDLGDPASLAKAVDHLAYLDRREQRSAVLTVERAKRLAELGRLEESLVAAERAVRLAPFDADHRELAATAALRLGRLGEAERHIAALVEIEPDREIHRLRLRRVRERMSG